MQRRVIKRPPPLPVGLEEGYDICILISFLMYLTVVILIMIFVAIRILITITVIIMIVIIVSVAGRRTSARTQMRRANAARAALPH